jgi:hypothetical protein
VLDRIVDIVRTNAQKDTRITIGVRENSLKILHTLGTLLRAGLIRGRRRGPLRGGFRLRYLGLGKNVSEVNALSFKILRKSRMVGGYVLKGFPSVVLRVVRESLPSNVQFDRRTSFSVLEDPINDVVLIIARFLVLMMVILAHLYRYCSLCECLI